MCFIIFQNEKTPFLAKKSRSSENQKLKIFSKGLVRGLSPKLAIFPSNFCLGDKGQENVLDDILERKPNILGYKNKGFYKAKYCHFSKGVNPWFWSTFAIFQFLFCQYGPAKCVSSYSRWKKRLSWLKKQEVKKIIKLRFFQRGQSVGQVQNWPYFHHIFLCDKGQDNVLYDILQRKTKIFQAIKTTGFIGQKLYIFPKGLLHGFGPKLAIFRIFFFANIGHQNVFYHILEGKNAFLG